MATDATTYIICPGCGLQLPDKGLPMSDQFNATGECRELYHELSYYTLAKGDTVFIHEVIVDAYNAQHAGGPSKDITVTFALAGLYLYLDKGYTGRQARQANVTMAAYKGYKWPHFLPPTRKDWLTIDALLAAADKDTMINKWAESTWQAWQKDRERVIAVCNDVLP